MKLIPSVRNSRVLLEQTGVFRGIGSVCKARCDSLCLPRRFTATLSSCQHRHHVSTCHSHTKRFYSEISSESSDSKTSTGVFLEESRELDGESTSMSKSSSTTFTLDVLVSLLRQENAVDICVVKVPEHIKYTQYFIVVSGVSTRHLRAMALYAIKVVTNIYFLIVECLHVQTVFVFKSYTMDVFSTVQISEARRNSECQD